MPDIANDQQIPTLTENGVNTQAANAAEIRRLALEHARIAREEDRARIKAEQDAMLAAVMELEAAAVAARRARTEAHLELLDIVRRLPQMSDRRKKAILTERFGLEPAEARRLLVDGREEVRFKQVFLRHSLAPATIDALLRVRKDVRDLAIADLEAGYRVSKSDLTRLKSMLTIATPEKVRAERKRCLSKASGELVKVQIDRFMEDIRGFVAELCEFHAVHEEGDMLTLHEDEAARRAGELLIKFEALFDAPKLYTVITFLREIDHKIWMVQGDRESSREFHEERAGHVSADEENLANALDSLVQLRDRKFVSPSTIAELDNYLEARLIRPLAWLSDFDLTAFERRLEDGQIALWEMQNAEKVHFSTVEEKPLISLEICSGAGGQALGLHEAGFTAMGLYERDRHAVQTLNANPHLGTIFQGDVRHVDFKPYRGAVDLFAGGVPCQPYSSAGNMMGEADERDLFHVAVDIIKTVQPRAIMLENVKAFGFKPTALYRAEIFAELKSAGYEVALFPTAAKDYGLAQARPRLILVGFRDGLMRQFKAPPAFPQWETTVGQALLDLMSEAGWPGADDWAARANAVGPTIVGASNTAGGQGFSSKFQFAAWEKLGIDPKAVGIAPPNQDTPADAMPRLTLKMGARLQGFPNSWEFMGPRGERRRQIANALPPIVAAAFGIAIKEVLDGRGSTLPLTDDQAKERELKFETKLARLRRFAVADLPGWSSLEELRERLGLPFSNVPLPREYWPFPDLLNGKAA